LYRQQYCGCIFSEFERFKDTDLHLYKGGEE
jgi:predicted adenine nucleotide alpha hydrolase (AANH) superfamily ATPase